MSGPGPQPPPFNPSTQPNVAVPQPPTPSPLPSSGRASFAVLVAAFVVLAGAVAFFVTRGGDPPSPGEAVQDWAMALYDQDVERICDGLAASSVEQIESDGRSCEEQVEETFAVIDEPEAAGSTTDDEVGLLRPIESARTREPSIEILDVEVEGDRAAVRVQVDDSQTGATRPIILVREDGRWKIDVDGGVTIDGPSRSCETEERSVETAVEAYRAQNGEYPPDARALVDARLLRKLPEHAEVAADGSVRMTGECA